jgi:hypothetical protein
MTYAASTVSIEAARSRSSSCRNVLPLALRGIRRSLEGAGIEATVHQNILPSDVAPRAIMLLTKICGAE